MYRLPLVDIRFCLLAFLGTYWGVFAPGYAQSVSPSDSAVYQQLTQNIYKQYRQHSEVQALIYQGKAYSGFGVKAEGHPFFESEEWEKGTIHYDGLTYSDVDMKYDVVNAVVLVKHHQIAQPIELENERVGSFSLRDHRFIRLLANGSSVPVPRTDFYDELYTGARADLLVIRKKLLMETIEDREVVYWFEDATRYYIRQQDTYHPVKNKRTLLRVLTDRKKAVKRFMKQHKLKFKRGREEAILRTVVYYDQLAEVQ